MSSLFQRILQFKICKKEINYSKLNPKNWKWKRPSFKKIIRGLAFLIIFLGALITVKDEIEWQFGLGMYSDSSDYMEEDLMEATCNVAGIELHGNVVTYISPEDTDKDGNQAYDETASENVVVAIEAADNDETVKAIILEVDSYGGSAVAAEEISQALKKVNKPTVAFVRSAAVSAAYWAASGADTIFASDLSDIGSIGVTMSYLDNTKKNLKDGLTYNSLGTGKFKDYGNPDKPLTEDEKRLIMRDLEIIHNIFIKAVSENRDLPVDKVKLLADGSSMPGQMALENKLIDRIGGIYDVNNYLKEKLGEEVDVCW